VPENRSTLCITLYTQVVSIGLECDNIGERNGGFYSRLRVESTFFCLAING